MNISNLSLSVNVEGKIAVDFRGFHDRIKDYYESLGYLSSLMIDEKDIKNLLEPTISFILRHKFNIHVVGNSSSSLVTKYFSREEFIELFDDMFIDFNLFLEDHGITSQGKYVLVRLDNFDCYFIEVPNEQFKTILDQYSVIQEIGE